MVGKVKKIFMIHLCNWIKHLDTEEVEEAFCRSAVQTEDSCRMGGGGGRREMGSIMVAIIKLHWDMANSQHANIVYQFH